MRRLISILVCCGFAGMVSGCGYHWQGNGNIWEKEKIQKVYIRTLENKTLTSGVETFFTSSIIREIEKNSRLKVTNSEKEADAVLWGSVTSVSRGGTTGTDVALGQLSTELGAAQLQEVPVFTEYTATASVTLTLTRRSDGKQVWNGGFSHPGYLFPASVHFGLPGTTTALINDSEFMLALNEVAKTIATDVEDALMEHF